VDNDGSCGVAFTVAVRPAFANEFVHFKKLRTRMMTSPGNGDSTAEDWKILGIGIGLQHRRDGMAG